MTADERALAIADKIVPAYRNGTRSYSCTGHVAKMWQAAYDGALSIADGDTQNADYDPSQFDKDFAAAIDARCMGTAPNDDLRALSDAAKPGPWKVFSLLPGTFEVCKANNYSTGGVCVPHSRADADFIVAAVNFARAALGERKAGGGEA